MAPRQFASTVRRLLGIVGWVGVALSPTLARADVMCAHVLSAPTTGLQRSFCARGGRGQPCRWASWITCSDDSADAFYYPANGCHGELFPWYQEAIYWAKRHGYRYVHFDPGTITVTAWSAIPADWPWGDGVARTVGLHVPSHMEVRGFDAYLAGPTIINMSQGLGSVHLSTMVLVADAAVGRGTRPAADASVKNFTLVGGSSTGTDCPSDGQTMTSINDMDARPAPTWGRTALNDIWADTGMAVDQSDGTAGTVVLDHLKIAHVGSGIMLGFRSPWVQENPACATTSCLRLQLSPLSCTGTVQSTSQAPACTTNYCLLHPFAFYGATSFSAQVANNSICDVSAGVAIVGGRVDVHHNVILGGRYFDNQFTAGVIPDGEAISMSHDYIDGFGLGVETDGSPYSYIDDTIFRTVTGADAGTCATWQDRLNLNQWIFDDTSRWFLTIGDAYHGFGHNLRVQDNRIYNSSVGGVALYRQDWAWVGWNVIKNGPKGVSVGNTINTWVWGNSIQNMSQYGIELGGRPGVNSLLGSCYDGVGIYCDTAGCPGGFSSPNTFSGTACRVRYQPGYCSLVSEAGHCAAQ